MVTVGNMPVPWILWLRGVITHIFPWDVGGFKVLNVDAQPGADVQHIAYKMDLYGHGGITP